MSNLRNPRRLAIVTAIAAVLAAGGAAADTLDQALVQAWQTNPNLKAASESLAAADAQVDAAQGNYYPQVKLFGGLGTAHQGIGFMNIPGFNLPISYIALNTRQAGLEVDQPLYAGGRISAGTDAATHVRDAEEAKMHSVEQDVLLSAVRAYMDVLQAQAVLSLEQSDERVLQQALDDAQASFDNGEVTHTDVNQAKARLAGAQAARIQAEGALATARASYQRAIGPVPDNLSQPGALNGLPPTQDAALALAEHNYDLVAARYVSDAAQDNVDIASSALKPSLELSGQVSKASEPQFLFERLDNRSIMLQLSVPLYTGGVASSQVHAAEHQAASSQQQALDVQRQARDQAIQAWEVYQTAAASLAAIEVQITAAQSAYDGVEAEYKEGERTTLDVLNAEQELLDAQVNEVRAKRDETVAEYALDAAVGGLTAEQLKLPVNPAVQGG